MAKKKTQIPKYGTITLKGIQYYRTSITEAFWMASRNPARMIGMDKEIGTIEPSKKANLVFMDDAFHVKKVMLDGTFQQISE